MITLGETFIDYFGYSNFVLHWALLLFSLTYFVVFFFWIGIAVLVDFFFKVVRIFFVFPLFYRNFSQLLVCEYIFYLQIVSLLFFFHNVKVIEYNVKVIYIYIYIFYNFDIVKKNSSDTICK